MAEFASLAMGKAHRKREKGRIPQNPSNRVKSALHSPLGLGPKIGRDGFFGVLFRGWEQTYDTLGSVHTKTCESESRQIGVEQAGFFS